MTTPTNNFAKIKNYVAQLADIELLALNHDIQKLEMRTDNALIYHLMKINDELQIQITEINDLMWPLCQVLAERVTATKMSCAN